MRGAGGGRPEKPADQRRNRAKPTTTTTVVEPKERPIPAPTAMLEPDEWKLWCHLWLLPESALWSDLEVPLVTRYVRLATNGDISDPKMLQEIRQVEDRLLMNPYVRRQTKTEFAKPDPADAKAGKRSSYSHLRAVEGA